MWQGASVLVMAASGAVALSCASNGARKVVSEPAASAAPNRPSVPAVTATATPAPPSPSLPTRQDPCRVAEALTLAAIARADAFAQDVMAQQLAAGAYQGERPQLPLSSYELTSWLSCTKTPGGAWAIVLGKALLTPRNEGDWTAEWVLDGEVMLAHVDAVGASR